MFIYFACSKKCKRSSNAMKYAKEFLKMNFALWSTTISLGLGEKCETDAECIDDNFGNTDAAIIVVTRQFLKEDLKSVLAKVIRYDTIQIFIILDKCSSKEFEEFVQKEFGNQVEDKLNDIYSSEDGMKNIVSEIGATLAISSEETTEKIPTGIQILDFLTGGGLIRGSSLNIVGPSGSGKTTLGVQIQKHVLEMGFGCLYITYSEAPIKILRRFVDVGCDITKYIKSGKFRIYDSYSSLNALTAEDTKKSVGEEWYPAIIRVEDPTDSIAYFENQIKAIEQIGPGGVNIIDCVNTRYEISKEQKTSNGPTYKEHFTRFKAKAGDTLQNVGIHIVVPDDKLMDHLTRVEDGNIRLKIEMDETGAISRYLRVEEHGQLGRGDGNWYEYTISKRGIKFLPVNFKEDEDRRKSNENE